MKNIVILLALFASAVFVLGQGTAFTYQGRLIDQGAPAAGIYDLRFTIHDALTGGGTIGGALTNSATSVSNGLFTVTLDFGPSVFNGAERWLEIGVRTNGGELFTPLDPRQRITSTPYAITAGNLSGVISNSSIAGTYSNALTLNNPANQFTGTFFGSGGGLTNVNAQTLGGLLPSSFWTLTGNNVAPGQFLGSTNDQPVEIRVKGQTAMRYEPTFDTPNVVGGWMSNYVQPGLAGVTIGGGGSAILFDGSPQPNLVTNNGNYATIAGGYNNTVQGYGGVVVGGSVNTVAGNFGLIGGGQFHSIDSSAVYSVIGGGYTNVVGGQNSVIGGGSFNLIRTNTYAAVVGGGSGNVIEPGAGGAVVGGGFVNAVQRNAFVPTISGGFGNTNAAAYGVIGGGFSNTIETNNSSTTIAGGANNLIRDNVWYGFIGGGNVNTIHPGSGYSVLAGGLQNTIQSNAGFSVIAGGVRNMDASGYSAIGGGDNNSIGTNSSHSTIAGGNLNVINNALWATIAGGQSNTNLGRYAFLGGGLANSVEGFQSVLGGGVLNSISANSSASVIAGGSRNVIFPNTSGDVIGGGFNNVLDSITLAGTIAGGWSNVVGRTDAATIAGGFRNSIQFGGDYSFIGGGALNTNHGFISLVAGGRNNTILPLADHSVIGGGRGNRISGSQTLDVYATIGGGQGNTVLTNAPYATIPGGFSNAASAYSFAAGNRAKAIHQGSFVWADSTDADFATTTSNQFLIRASGGVGINTTNPTAALEVVGAVKAGGFMDNGSGFLGNGGGLTNVNAQALGGVAPSNYWRLGGNFISTFPLSLGTIEQYPMTFIAGNRTALRLEPGSRFQFPSTTLRAPNVIGGSEANVVSNGVLGATIAGGGQIISVIGPGSPYPNVVSDDFGTIGGGLNNTVGNTNASTSDVRAATVSGGSDNIASGSHATVPGGNANVAAGNFSFAAGNQAKANHQGSFVWADSTFTDFASAANDQFLVRALGGADIFTGISFNQPFNPGLRVTDGLNGNINFQPLGGGNSGYHAINFNGFYNGAEQRYNTSKSRWRLVVDQRGASDTLSIDVFNGTTVSGVVGILTNGNVGIGTTAPTNKLHVFGGATFTSGTGAGTHTVVWTPGSASWSFTSDRNAKERVTSVNAQSVLEKVSRLPITEWSYIGCEQRHIGPMAQDFHEQFPLNENDKALNDADLHGVALAAIQGLNQKLAEELKRRDVENSQLKQRLEVLEKIVADLSIKGDQP